jgi:uncharacterized protein (TIRG00374 family)
MKRQKWLLAFVGLLISLVFLLIAFRNLHPEQVLLSLGQANGLLLIIAALWYFVAVAAISLRWRFLLKAIKPLPLGDLIALVCIGYAGNNIYPFRSGELLRILLLQRQFGVALARGTITVVVERVFDGLVLISFVLLPLLSLDLSSPEVRTAAAIAAPPFLLALALFFVVAARPNLLRALLRWLSRWLPGSLQGPLTTLTEDVITGLSGLRTPLDLAGTVIFSFVAWALKASVCLVVAWAFDLDAGYLVMLVVVGVVNLAGLIPASPGQFGVFEALTSLVLVAAGVPEVQALAFALTVHMVIWLPVTLLGLFFLLQRGLGFSAITQAARPEKKTLSYRVFHRQ